MQPAVVFLGDEHRVAGGHQRPAGRILSDGPDDSAQLDVFEQRVSLLGEERADEGPERSGRSEGDLGAGTRSTEGQSGDGGFPEPGGYLDEALERRAGDAIESLEGGDGELRRG